MVTLEDVDFEASVGHGPAGHLKIFANDSLDRGRFIVRHKLGVGKFSVVWKCWDSEAKKDVAIKVGRCSSGYVRAIRYEAQVLQSAAERIPGYEVPYVFETVGENGKHACIVLPIRGQTLMWVLDVLAEHDEYLPVDLVASWTADLCEDLEGLHAIGFIHSDIKMDNLLLDRPVTAFIDITDPAQLGLRPDTDFLIEIAKSEVHGLVGVPRRHMNRRISRLRKSAAAGTRNVSEVCIKARPFDYDKFVSELRGRYAILTDFSNAIHESEVRDEDKEFQSAEYRCPEVLLGLRFTTLSDLWSVGCVVFELATNEMLFEPKGAPGRYDTQDDHVAQILELIGLPPVDMVERHLDRAAMGLTPAIFKEAFVYGGSFDVPRVCGPVGDEPSEAGPAGPVEMGASPLRRIDKLRIWPAASVLHDKYGRSVGDCLVVSDLMNYMLKWDPNTRDTLTTLTTVCRAIVSGTA